MKSPGVKISLSSVLLFLMCTFCIIMVASERSRRKSSYNRRKRIGSLYRDYEDEERSSTKYSKLFPKVASSKRLEQRMRYRSRAQRLRGDTNEGYEDFNYNDEEVKRDKRFYPIEPGCLKGYACCQIPYCRQYCTLCADKPYYVYGPRQPEQECEDLNMNTICDFEEEITFPDEIMGQDEETLDDFAEMLAEEQERKKKKKTKTEEEESDFSEMLAEEQERKKKKKTKDDDDEDTEDDFSEMLAEEQERKKKKKDKDDEEDSSEMLAEEQERNKKKKDKDEQAAEALDRDRNKKKDDDDDQDDAQASRNNTRTDLGQLEFTHHIYEEYLPSLPRESKAPIILQTIPQYSISNFYALNRHHHPAALSLTGVSSAAAAGAAGGAAGGGVGGSLGGGVIGGTVRPVVGVRPVLRPVIRPLGVVGGGVGAGGATTTVTGTTTTNTITGPAGVTFGAGGASGPGGLAGGVGSGGQVIGGTIRPGLVGAIGGTLGRPGSILGGPGTILGGPGTTLGGRPIGPLGLDGLPPLPPPGAGGLRPPCPLPSSLDSPLTAPPPPDCFPGPPRLTPGSLTRGGPRLHHHHSHHHHTNHEVDLDRLRHHKPPHGSKHSASNKIPIFYSDMAHRNPSKSVSKPRRHPTHLFDEVGTDLSPHFISSSAGSTPILTPQIGSGGQEINLIHGGAIAGGGGFSGSGFSGGGGFSTGGKFSGFGDFSTFPAPLSGLRGTSATLNGGLGGTTTNLGGGVTATTLGGGGLANFPQPQTIIYQEKPDNSPPPPPQPILKYHLLRQSFPASGKEDYFAEIPAFLPGPPYVKKPLPDRRAPLVQRPPRLGRNSLLSGRKRVNRQGQLKDNRPQKTSSSVTSASTSRKKKKESKLGKLVRNLLG